MITDKQYNALKILEPTRSYSVVMAANTFAWRFWGADPEKKYLFEAVSNSGHGAAAGKKAWLCAGSFLAKLAKKKLIYWVPSSQGHHPTGYKITNEGLKAIREYESNKS